MKTAMQELIEKMNEAPLQFASALILIKSFNFLETEKKQIIESYNKGQKDFANYDPERHGNECKDGKQYYDSNFGYKVEEAGI